MMKKILVSALALAMATLAAAPAQAWRGGGFGGFHGGGGFVAHGPNGGWAAGGFHDAGGDAWHAGGVGGWGGTWHADGYHAGGWGGGYGYHGPVTVNSYYGGGCYGCGAAAGAVAGAAVGAAAVAGAVAARDYAIGATLATLPDGCIARVVGGGSYYVCDGAWLQPGYGNNGVFYTVVNPM
jgi:hypothetical protein